MPEISVIIPIYNAKQYINACVESLLCQTLKDFEVLLIDDGSTDGSGSLCDELCKEYSFMRAFHKENGGAASARNLGLDKATGKYVIFVDADDTVYSQYLEKLYTAAEENNADMVMCDYVKYTHKGRFNFSQPIRGGVYTREQIIAELYPCLIMFDDLEFPPTISNWTCIFKRDLLEDNGIRYPLVRLCEDSYFGSVCLYNAKTFVYLKEQFLYNYLYYPTSVSHSNAKEKTTARWKSFLTLNRLYREYFEGKEACFDMQLKYNMLYFTLNQLSYVSNNSSKKEKLKSVKEIFSEATVKNAFKGFKYPKVSTKLKIIIFLVKHRMARTYLIIHR